MSNFQKDTKILTRTVAKKIVRTLRVYFDLLVLRHPKVTGISRIPKRILQCFHQKEGRQWGIFKHISGNI